MVDLWHREPAVLREPVHAPIVVTGLGRSGTTLLHELLACDPDNRPPLLWELLHSVPYEDASGDLCDDEIRLMDEMVPAFTAMHENGGRLPTECIFVFAHQFSSDMYTGTLQRGRVHDVAQRRGPGPDLRLAPAPSADAAVGSRAADAALGPQGALPPFRPAPPLFHLPRRAGRHHPPRSAPGHRVAVRPHGHPALHALGPRRPRRAGRVHGHGAGDADGPRHGRA